jgi:predicted DNA-binding protein (UPF0251 family)
MTTDIAKQQKTDKRMQISEPIKQAINLIVTEGLQMDEAARKANVSTRTLRLALKRPHVLRFLKEAREMLIVPIIAQNPRRLAELRDQNSNLGAAVRAAVAIEGLADSSAAMDARKAAPGVSIVILQQAPQHNQQKPGVTIDLTATPPTQGGEDGR